MLDLAYFWLGPVGRMTPLPIPEQGVSSTIDFVGSEHLSLIAKRTYDVHGYRRTWGFTEAWLESDDVSLIESYYLRTIEAPLRLIDPLRKNRAFPAPAAGYPQPGWYNGINGFFVTDATHGGVQEMHSDGPLISYVGNGDSRDVSYGVDRFTEWGLAGAAPSTGTSILSLNGPFAGPQTNLLYTDPVIPGETITYSIYVRSLNGAEVRLALFEIDRVGTLGPSIESAITTSSTWERINVTYTVPTSGAVAAILPTLLSESVDGAIHLSNAQLENGDEATNWVMGLGCPEVTITEVGNVSQRWPLVTLNLTIKEL